MVSRAERTPFAAWWWTIDRLMLVALGAIEPPGAATPVVGTAVISPSL